MLDQSFVAEMKQKLEEQKAKLSEDLKGLHFHTEVGDDYDENATEVEIDEVNRDLIVRMQDDIAKIDKALAKIEAGTYGTDDDGSAIGEDRLRAMPWADKAI